MKRKDIYICAKNAVTILRTGSRQGHPGTIYKHLVEEANVRENYGIASR
jgi:hypothetical protein